MSQFFGEHLYRIGKAAHRLGVSIQTLRNWIYSGKIQTWRTVGGEHRIPESEIRHILGIPAPKKQTVLYSRVSSHGQKADLETQERLLEQFAIENGYTNLVQFRDIATGLNPKRRGLRKIFKLIDANQIDTLLVNYKDRLTRFGFEYLESYFNSHGAKVLVLNQAEIQDPQKN
ncbi:MAG: IS607 family transposase [Promethearchaeota archaeon]